MSNTSKRPEQQQQQVANGAAIAPSEPPIQELPSEASSPSPSRSTPRTSSAHLPPTSAPSTPGLLESSNPLEGGGATLAPFTFTPAKAPSTGSVRQLARSASARSVGLSSTPSKYDASSEHTQQQSQQQQQGEPSTSTAAEAQGGGERNYIFSRLRAAPNVEADATRLHRARARGQRKMSDSNLPSHGAHARAQGSSSGGAGKSGGRFSIRPFARKSTSHTRSAQGGEVASEDGSAVDEGGHAILSRDFQRKGRAEAEALRVEDAKRDGARLGREAALVEVRNAVMGFVGSGSGEGQRERGEGEGSDPLAAFQALMGHPNSSTNDARSKHSAHHVDHGTHPGLAGRRAGTNSGTGAEGETPRVPARIAGGPGAPTTLRQASNAGPTLGVSVARELNSGAFADAERASKNSRQPRQQQQQQQQTAGREAEGEGESGKPSMLGASRFPGGRVMSAQGSVGAQASHQLTQQQQSKVDERDSSTLASRAPSPSASDASSHQGDTNEDLQLASPPHKTGSPLARYRWRFREFLAELLASTLLLTIGSSVNAQVHLSQDLTRSQAEAAGTFSSINFAWGFAVLCTIHVAGGISGAHANPAVTLSLALFRGFPWKLVPVYLLAQLTGSFIGAAIAYGLYLPAIDAWEGKGVRTVFGEKATASLFVTIPTQQTTPLTAFFNEVVGSAVLAIMVFAVGDESNSPPGDGMSGLILGLTVTMIGMSLGWLSGYAINAARDLGPRIFLTTVGYPHTLWTHDSHWWIYGPIIGTLFGAILGSAVYDLTIFQGFDSPLNRRWHRPKVHNMVRGLKRVTVGEREQEVESERELGREEERAEKGMRVDSAANSTKEAVKRRWAAADAEAAESHQTREV